MSKPNMRTMFIPDEGFCFIEPDYAQADLRVVAWEAYAAMLVKKPDAPVPELIHRLNDPTLDIHIDNAKIVFHTTEVDFQKRQDSKRAVHAADYLVGPPKLAKSLGILTHQADQFIKRWLAANPEIRIWHKHVGNLLQTTRTIYNKFGFRIRYFDRVEQLLPEALAWIPQSTVAICVSKGILKIEAALPPKDIFPSLHCHDSPLLQARISELPRLKPLIRECMTVPVPYEPMPLVMPIELKLSTKSWGDTKKASWDA